jgi:hypothetical protein
MEAIGVLSILIALALISARALPLNIILRADRAIILLLSQNISFR